MKRILLAVFLIPFVAAALGAQKVDRSFYYDYGENFYYEVHNIPAVSEDSTRFLALYSLRYDKLKFTRASKPISPKKKFSASPLLYVEFIDSEGVIRYSREIKDTIFAANYEETLSKKKFVHGSFIVTLPPQTYDVVFDFGHSRSPRSQKYRQRDVKGLTYLSEASNSDALFAKPVDQHRQSDLIMPFALRNSIPFASDMRILISVSDENLTDKYEYVIRKIAGEKIGRGKPEPPTGFADIVGDALPEADVLIGIDSSSSQRRIRLRKQQVNPVRNQGLGIPSDVLDEVSEPAVTTNDRMKLGLLDIPIASSQMGIGKYELLVYKNGSEDTVRQKFDIEWINKPLSLRNVQYAVDIASYVLTEDELDDINSGSLKNKYENLMQYWETKDPTPGTAYNEAMAEYYARVDYAFFNFQSLSDRDGALTDRGKIFILFGKPTDTDRKLTPDSPTTETWRYDNNVKKEFLFESPNPGVFVLKKMRNL